MKILVALSLMVCSIVCPAGARETPYGKKLEHKREAAWSPNKRYKIETVPFLQKSCDNHVCHLFLVQQGYQKRRPVKLDDTNGYDHFVEVLWSPTSMAFVVNLYDPGRTACSYLYNVNDLGHRVDIEQRLKLLIKDKDQMRVFHSRTMQGIKILATRWINSKWLEIRIEDDKVNAAGHYCESFSLTYRWNLKDKLFLEPQKDDKISRVPS
ncbi:MAG: hypothetical protein P4L53_00905 [Candidatus Obscuribacterales bacterium]|nr:hypothetical protein [Candidatus Obscuribacterales bacterium]